MAREGIPQMSHPDIIARAIIEPRLGLMPINCYGTLLQTVLELQTFQFNILFWRCLA